MFQIIKLIVSKHTHPRVLELLRITTFRGLTPLDTAQIAGQAECVAYLEGLLNLNDPGAGELHDWEGGN